MPERATWIKDAVAGFEPERNRVMRASGSAVDYDYLVVAMGLQIDWDAIEGLPAILGKNGVTSNYRFDLAPYTHELATKLGKQTVRGRMKRQYALWAWPFSTC